MSDTTERRPAPKKRIDPDRFAELVQRMESKKAALDLDDQALIKLAATRNEAAARWNEARDNLRRYIQECGGPA